MLQNNLALGTQNELATNTNQDRKDSIVDMATRSRIAELILAYSKNRNIPYYGCWNTVWLEFRNTYQINSENIAKNKSLKPMDIAEQLGMLEQLWSVAVAVCTKNNKDN